MLLSENGSDAVLNMADTGGCGFAKTRAGLCCVVPTEIQISCVTSHCGTEHVFGQYHPSNSQNNSR